MLLSNKSDWLGYIYKKEHGTKLMNYWYTFGSIEESSFGSIKESSLTHLGLRVA